VRAVRPTDQATAGDAPESGYCTAIAAEGSKSDIAKPMKGLGPGVYEIALAYRSDAYRTVYAVKLGEDIWVVHAFQKKSTKGIKTPKREVDLIRSRISQLKEQLR